MFDVAELRREIEAILRENADLADDEVLRTDMLDGETDIRAVLSWLYQVSSDNKSMVEAISARIEKLAMRRDRFKVRVQRLRGLMLQVLQSADLKKIELAEATLSQRASQPQIVGTALVDDLPDDLVRTIREPDRVAIRAALLARREVPGLALSNAPPTLAINAR